MQLERFHWLIEQEWNMNSNSHRRYLTDLEKDELINQSVFDYIEIFAHGHNPKGFDLGFEVTQQMIDMLDTLVEGYPDEPMLSPEDIGDGYYKFDFANTSKPFKSYVSSSIKIRGCSYTIGINPEQHGDMNKVKASYHRRPSKMWKNIPAVQRKDTLIVYADDLIPVGLQLTYIRKPKRVALGTYTDVPTAENPTPAILNRQEIDLPEDYHHLLLRIVIQNLYRIYNIPQGEILTDKKIKELT